MQIPKFDWIENVNFGTVLYSYLIFRCLTYIYSNFVIISEETQRP